MTVLAAGGTRSWRGPGFYSLVAPARPLILANGRTARVQTGVVRSAPRQEGVQPTDFWQYDIRSDGNLCVAGGARPMLWRPRSAAPARVTLTASGVTHSFEWPVGQFAIPWPNAVPLRNGGRYFLNAPNFSRSVRITTHLLPAGASERMDDIAVQMVARGCQAQLDTMLATREDPTAPLATATAGGIGSVR
jgi:hypothetical protein